MKPVLDIIICSYHRNELLKECLDALLQQSQTKQHWSVCLVNNTSTIFPEYILNRVDSFQNGQIVQQTRPGLSIARNTGIAQCSAPWIAFLDDDAKAPHNYVSKIMEIIKCGNYDCFGGHIKSWWKYGQPRWLEDNFGSKPYLANERCTIDESYNWGSNLIIRRTSLNDVGLFPTNIGMKGTKLGYAAENIVQMKLRQKGLKVGYDPNLFIEHVVMSQKLKLIWHLQSSYATGRDGRQIFQEQYGPMGFVSSLKNCFSRPLKAIYYMLMRRDYYWENALLDALKPYFLLMGKIRSLF